MTPPTTIASWPYFMPEGPVCVFCSMGNHRSCLGVCWRVSKGMGTAAERRRDPDGPKCACPALGHPEGGDR